MRLAETHYDNRETGCCAKLDAAQWEGRELNWSNKPFLKAHLLELMHLPLNFGSVMGRAQAQVEAAAAHTDPPLWLTDEVSPWGADLYLAVDRDVPGATLAYMTGSFLTKVFEGPYSQIGHWLRDMDEYVKGRGHSVRKMYFYYATCPKCAKHFGKNQVVLFAQVA